MLEKLIVRLWEIMVLGRLELSIFAFSNPSGKNYSISLCLGLFTVKLDKQQICKSSNFDADYNWILQNDLYFVAEVLWVSLTEELAELILVFAKFKS